MTVFNKNIWTCNHRRDRMVSLWFMREESSWASGVSWPASHWPRPAPVFTDVSTPVPLPLPLSLLRPLPLAVSLPAPGLCLSPAPCPSLSPFPSLSRGHGAPSRAPALCPSLSFPSRSPAAPSLSFLFPPPVSAGARQEERGERVTWFKTVRRPASLNTREQHIIMRSKLPGPDMLTYCHDSLPWRGWLLRVRKSS